MVIYDPITRYIADHHELASLSNRGVPTRESMGNSSDEGSSSAFVTQFSAAVWRSTRRLVSLLRHQVRLAPSRRSQAATQEG